MGLGPYPSLDVVQDISTGDISSVLLHVWLSRSVSDSLIGLLTTDPVRGRVKCEGRVRERLQDPLEIFTESLVKRLTNLIQMNDLLDSEDELPLSAEAVLHQSIWHDLVPALVEAEDLLINACRRRAHERGVRQRILEPKLGSLLGDQPQGTIVS